METKTILSIGIIFKNEIRCLERCLKSLQPLRDAVPCELVMADTGSDDGSREVAKKYADVLFDFPWINDFAAARNAVMDRCSGEWYFSIDSDQWLDGDIRELTAFLRQDGRDRVDACGMMERNYDVLDATDGNYSIFTPIRLLRMATGRRYIGAIHESWNMTGLRTIVLSNTVLHHDGYVEMDMDTAAGREKRKRNVTLLRESLEAEPEDLRRHLQFIESGTHEPDYPAMLRESLALVEKRVPSWENLGGAIYRYAIGFALEKELPETEEWLQRAEELFPDSYFIRLDAAFAAAGHYMKKEKYAESVRWSELYLRSYEDFQAGRGDLSCQAYSALQKATPFHEAALKIVLARAYHETGRTDEALALLDGLDCTRLDDLWTGNLSKTLQVINSRGLADMSGLIVKVWEDIQRPEPDEKWAERRRLSFLREGALRFDPAYLERESEEDVCLPYYTLYLPLGDKCILGIAASILESESPAEMEKLLGMVEEWRDLPVAALSRAIRAGVQFPLPGRTMNIEDMDSLTAQLARTPEGVDGLLKQAVEEDYAGSWQTLSWVRGLVMSSVYVCDWKDVEAGMWLARTFAKVENAFLTGCYAPEVLREGNLFVLPPTHRFGWYCAQAFEALEAGDAVGYVRLLREALASHKGMKKMAEFLLEHTPELQTLPPDPETEMEKLAEQIRAKLASYSADDPAVKALKSSPLYQKIAHLIERNDA